MEPFLILYFKINFRFSPTCVHYVINNIIISPVGLKNTCVDVHAHCFRGVNTAVYLHTLVV